MNTAVEGESWDAQRFAPLLQFLQLFALEHQPALALLVQTARESVTFDGMLHASHRTVCAGPRRASAAPAFAVLPPQEAETVGVTCWRQRAIQ